MYSMNVIQKNPDIIESSDCILNMLCVVDLSLILILFNNSYGIYLILKGSKYTVLFLSINNKAHCVPLLYFSSRFMTFAPSFF